jgi:hypothetical protein
MEIKLTQALSVQQQHGSNSKSASQPFTQLMENVMSNMVTQPRARRAHLPTIHPTQKFGKKVFEDQDQNEWEMPTLLLKVLKPLAIINLNSL